MDAIRERDTKRVLQTAVNQFLEGNWGEPEQAKVPDPIEKEDPAEPPQRKMPRRAV